MATKGDITSEIRSAFRDVTLDGGISLAQSRVIDRYGEGTSSEEFARLPEKEVTQDWAAIPMAVLDGADCIAHLDQKGLKYYLPALMLRLIDNYDDGSMMTIGTLSALDPRTESREYLLSELDRKQCRAVAAFLRELPNLVELGYEDSRVVERAYDRYWFKYLSD